MRRYCCFSFIKRLHHADVIARAWPSIHELRRTKLKGMIAAGMPFSLSN